MMRWAAVFHLSLCTTVKQAPTTVQKLLDNTRNKERHSHGDEACEPYTEPLSKDVSFAEASDVLSNFYPRGIKVHVFGTVHYGRP